MPKFQSVEEIRTARKELDGKFDGGLPDYLVRYFDDEELAKVERDYYNEIYSTPRSDRIKWSIEQKKVFDKNTETLLVKKPKRTKFSVEPPRAEERVEQERELTQDEINALIKMCESDMYLFALRYFPHYLKKASSELHHYLYRTITRELGRKVRKGQQRGCKWAIAAPRGGAKSSIVSNILPLWAVCYKKKKFIIMVSDTTGQAEDFLADVKRELEFNEKLKRDFPGICSKGPTWRADEIITNNGIRVRALGTGSKIRGRKFGVDRPDLIIGDDLENSEMVRSKTQRDSIRYSWFNKDLVFAGVGESGDDEAGTDFIIVGTILGKDSLLNALLDPSEYPDWDSRRFKAVLKFSDSKLWDEWEKLYKNRFDAKRKETARLFFDKNEEEMLLNTDVLWPEGDPYYSLMVDMIKDPSGFISEKQNSPVDLTKIYVTKDELHWENFDTPKMREIFRRCLFYGSLDPSLGKKSAQGDYSCIITLARDPKTGYVYVIKIDLKRRTVDDQIESILKAHVKYKYKLFSVETNAFQYVVADSLRKKSRKEGIYVPIKEVNQYLDKKLRFEGVVPFLKDGTIVFNKYRYKRDQMYNKGIEQICTFTGEGDSHDDCPDSLEMAFSIAKKPRFKPLYRETK